MASSSKTLKQVLEASASFLEGKKIESARLASEFLAARLLDCRRLDLYLRYDTELPGTHLEAMRRGVKRVAAGEPVQYVLGQAVFMDHVFKVDRRALVPRPETEILVKVVLDCEDLWTRAKPAVLEVGVGSGCVTITLARARPAGLYVGVDISSEALELARENALALGVADQVAFACGEMSDVVDPMSLDAVISNPPYIPSGEIDRLPVQVRDHEPRVALDGGPDGLGVIDGLVQDAAFGLKPGGFLFLEIGKEQGAEVTGRLEREGFIDVELHKDLADRDRVVRGRLPADD